MPEGHTLHRLATALDEAFAGHEVRVSSPQGRFADSAALLDGRRVEGAESWGKHLWVRLGHDDLVHVHLGLYGRFDVFREAVTVPAPVGQVRLRVVQADAEDGGTASYADLRGATACELQTPEQRLALVDRLGPDPLRPDADPDLAWHRIKRSRAPIAGLLMDQNVIAGIGNVYRAELLFRHRVDPFRPGSSLRPGRWAAMWEDLVELMQDGVRVGVIRTVRWEDLTEVERADGQRVSYVYRRAGEPCRVCGTRVRTRELQGRNLYWCARCQPRFRSRALQ